MKRTFEVIGVTHKKTRSHKITLALGNPLIRHRFRQTYVQTDNGYTDVTVELDRWGRLKSVKIERSRH